jgi:HlyD family secretion protein
MWKRAFFVVATLAILIVGGTFIARAFKSAAESKAQVQHRVATVNVETVKKTVTATGVLKAWRTVDIKSRAGGKLIKIAVEDGDMVSKGQMLAQIDPSDTLMTLNSARADIDSNRARIDQTNKELSLQQAQTEVSIATAEASLRSAQASAAAAKARYESARSQANAQQSLTDAALASARATLAVEKERLEQMQKATQPTTNAQARAAVRQAEANLKNAEQQMARQKALLEKGFVSQSAVDQAQATYDVAEATLTNARERFGVIKPEFEADIRTQQARIQQAQAQLSQAEANKVDVELRKQSAQASLAEYERAQADVLQSAARLKQAKAEQINNSIRLSQIAQAKAQSARSQATYKNAEDQYRDTTVTAPSDGIILKKYLEEGTLISSGMSFNSAGTAIIQMGDTSRMYVDVQVDETDIASIEMDQKVDITFDSYATAPFEGKVIKVDPQAVVEQNVTTFHVRVEVDNSDIKFKLLKPGMNATCEFIINRKDDVVAVPNEAIKTDNADNSSYVEIPIGGKVAPAEKDAEVDKELFVGVKPEKRKITAGLVGNDLTEVTEGLKEGDKVITQTIEPAPPTTGGGNPFGGSRGPGRR